MTIHETYQDTDLEQTAEIIAEQARRARVMRDGGHFTGFDKEYLDTIAHLLNSLEAEFEIGRATETRLVRTVSRLYKMAAEESFRANNVSYSNGLVGRGMALAAALARFDGAQTLEEALHGYTHGVSVPTRY